MPDGPAARPAGARRARPRAEEPAPAPGSTAPDAPPDAPAARPTYSERTALRNAEARAALAPLAPGERPRALVVAVVVALVAVAANLLAVALGAEGGEQGPQFTALVTLLGLAAAAGMWRRRHWAVLLFEALLGVQLALLCLALVTASNVAALVFCLGLLLPGGVLFWKLIRVMGRIQATERAAYDARAEQAAARQ